MSSVLSLCCETCPNVCQVSKINQLLLRFPHNLVVKIKNMISVSACSSAFMLKCVRYFAQHL